MSKKKKGRGQPEVVYKTESQIREEALAQAKARDALEAARPKSPAQKKWDNYWFHYKWVTIGSVIGIVMLALFVKDIIFKTNPDYTVVFISRYFYGDELLGEMTGALSQYADDRNGDNKILVQTESMTLPLSLTLYEEEEIDPQAPMEAQEMDSMMTGGMDAQTDYATAMKLMAVVAAGTDYIYLLDQAGYDYLVRMDGDDAEDAHLFVPLEGVVPGTTGDKLYWNDTVLGTEGELTYYQDTFFCLRINNSSKDKNMEYHQSSLELLQAIGAAK